LPIVKPNLSTNSTVRREAVAGQPAYVKQYAPTGWLQTEEIVRAQAAREVEIVGRLSSLPQLGGRLGLMKILESDASRARVVTREVPGRTLQDVLRRAGTKEQRAGCVRALFLAGKWLRAFQSLPPEEGTTVPAPDEPDDLVLYCDLRMKTLTELGYGWPDPRARRSVLDWIGRRVNRTPGEQLRRVWCHRDYGPANIIWDGRVLTPVDFGTCRLGLPLIDVTYLVHRLEMFSFQFPWRRWPLAPWAKACLRGYGEPECDRLPIYEALMLRHLLCRLQTLVRRPPANRRQKWHNAWVRGRVLARIRNLLAP